MAGNAVEAGRTVTSKVTAILMAFADGTEWSLSELARITNIPLTTTHRLVTELVAAQLLERSPEGYRVGPALGRLLRDRSDRRPDRRPARPGRPRRPRRRHRPPRPPGRAARPAGRLRREGRPGTRHLLRRRRTAPAARQRAGQGPARVRPRRGHPLAGRHRAAPLHPAHPDPRGPAAARAVGHPPDPDRDLRRRAGRRGDDRRGAGGRPGRPGRRGAGDAWCPTWPASTPCAQLLTVSARSMSRELAGPAAGDAPPPRPDSASVVSGVGSGPVGPERVDVDVLDRRGRPVRHRRRLPPAGRAARTRPTRSSRPATRSAAPGTCSATPASGPTPTCSPSATPSGRGRDRRPSPTARRSATTSSDTAREYGVDRADPVPPPGGRGRVVERRRRAGRSPPTHRHRRDRGADLLVPVRLLGLLPLRRRATRRRCPGRSGSPGSSCTRSTGPPTSTATGKRVVVIGSGATAVTLVPALAGDAAHVTMLQRSPSYVLSRAGPRPARRAAVGAGCRALAPHRDRAWQERAARPRCSTSSAAGVPALVRRQLLDAARAAAARRTSTSTRTSPPPTTRGTSGCASCPTATCSAAVRGGRRVGGHRPDRHASPSTASRSRRARELPADVVVTATGLTLQLLGRRDAERRRPRRRPRRGPSSTRA